jgi:hypothetical protein
VPRRKRAGGARGLSRVSLRPGWVQGIPPRRTRVRHSARYRIYLCGGVRHRERGQGRHVVEPSPRGRREQAASHPWPSGMCPQRAQEGRVRHVHISVHDLWPRGISIVLMVSRQLGIEMLWHDSCHDRLCRNGFVSDLVTSKIR